MTELADNEIVTENLGTKSPTSRSRLVALEVIEFNHLWTINNFSRYCKNFDKPLTSTYFSNPQVVDKSQWPPQAVKWYLQIELPRNDNRKSGKSNDDLSKPDVDFDVYLCVDEDATKISAKFKISILNLRNEKVFTKKSELHNFNENRYENNSNRFSLSIKSDDVFKNSKELLLNGQLRILCEVSVYDTFHKDTTVELNNSSKLPDDLWSMHENQVCTDVTLSVNGKEFHAHKAVLAASSSVFRAMFQHEMQEQKQNCVNITDINHQVINEMLRFMYTGKVLNVDMAADLLVAADKYALENLKVLCEKELSSNLLPENAVKMLVLGDLHTAIQLKSNAIKFIQMHITTIMRTPGSGWKDITQYPHLIDEMFCAYASSIPSLLPEDTSHQNKRMRLF